MEKDKKFFHGHSRFAEERSKLWPTQQQAADFFSVSRVTWGQCERGNSTPSGEVLAGLAQQGSDVIYILTGQRCQHAVAQPPADEQMLLDAYRDMDSAKKKQMLAMALGVSPPSSASQVRPSGSYSQHNSGDGAVQIGSHGGKVTIKKGR